MSYYKHDDNKPMCTAEKILWFMVGVLIVCGMWKQISNWIFG